MDLYWEGREPKGNQGRICMKRGGNGLPKFVIGNAGLRMPGLNMIHAPKRDFLGCQTGLG